MLDNDIFVKHAFTYKSSTCTSAILWSEKRTQTSVVLPLFEIEASSFDLFAELTFSEKEFDFINQRSKNTYFPCYSVTARKIGFLDRHTILVLLLWFNVTFSDISVIKWRDNCPVSHLLPRTQRHGQLGVFSVQSLPQHGHRDVRRRL